MPISKPQKELTDILKSIYGKNIKSNFRGFNWLRTDLGRRQEIDIWIPSVKLAVEYDGEQHFYPVKFGKMTDEEAEKRFNRTVALDKMKDSSIRNSKDVRYFIRFNYKDAIDKDSVLKKIKHMVREIPDRIVKEIYSMDDWLDSVLNPPDWFEFVDEDILR